jgi:hypothetical protein
VQPRKVGNRYRAIEKVAACVEVPYDFLDLHAAVVDVVGLRLASVTCGYDTSFAQAVAAVGEGGGRTVRGANAQPVLAIPGVRATGGVGKGVAVRVVVRAKAAVGTTVGVDVGKVLFPSMPLRDAVKHNNANNNVPSRHNGRYVTEYIQE